MLGDQYLSSRMGCARHPYEGTVGVCASCVSDRLSKESSSSDRGRFAKSSSFSEDYLLWKEGASSSSSISKHGVTKGGRIVDTIASLIKTDYAIPTNYERPRYRDRVQREQSSRSYASAERRISESSRKAVSTNEDAGFGRFNRTDVAKSERDSMSVSKSRDICEITPAEPEREPGQTIHSLMDAEPKVGKFSRSTSKGSPASYFSRSGSKRQSWTVFWRSDKKDDLGRAGGEVLRSVSDSHERASSRPVFNGLDTSDLQSRRQSEATSRSIHYAGRSSRREDRKLSTRVSAEDEWKRLADRDYLDRADSALEEQQRKTSAAAAASHSYERNRSWEQLGLAKLPFASVYAAPARSHISGVGEQRRNRWKMIKKKSEKLESKADDYHSFPVTTVHHPHVASTVEEDLGQSSGKPTPCTSNCFPQSGGRHILRREDAHISHEKLRHRRLSIYSYGIMSQPQLTALDSHLSFTSGRSRGSRPYTYNEKPREPYYPNGRIAVNYWDGDESISPCDHYVEVSHPRDGGSSAMIDFIPVSEAQKRAYDWVDGSKIGGNRSPPRWNGRRGESTDSEDEDDFAASSSDDMNFLGKEELTTVFEQDSESGFVEEYAMGGGERADDHYHHELNDEGLACIESRILTSYPVAGKTRLAKGKSIVTEIEELEEDVNHRREQLHFDQNGGEALLSTRSLSDAGSYARESTDSEIVPARNSLRSLFYMDGEEVEDVGGAEVHGGRAYKPDNAYEEEQDVGDWTPDPVDADHKDGQTNNSASNRRSPWKNITMSPSMRRKFLWPRSSPQPHLKRSFEATGNLGMFGSGHHQTSLSFSDTDSQLARPRSPTSTTENTSSNLMAPEGPEGTLPQALSDTLQDEITNGTSETVLSLVEVEESSLKSSPQRSSLSHTSSPQRASLSRSSSKSPERTLSRCSSRRSRSSSWSSCLTDPAWSSHAAPTKKGENGTNEKGPISSLIKFGKRLSRRPSPANNSFNTSPWRSFSKGSPQRGETTSP